MLSRPGRNSFSIIMTQVNSQTPTQVGIAPLGPLPSLDEKHLKLDGVDTADHGRLEAFVPSSADYHPTDPNAPALVLVPGLGMDGLGFLRQLPIGPHAHLHFFQTPNDPVRDEQGLLRFGRYVEEYILARKLDQRPGGVILGGCSMGGAISLAVALRGRVKLRGLVLLGTFGSCLHLPKWQRIAAPLAWFVPLRAGRRVFWHIVARSNFFGQIKRDEASWLVSCKLERTQRYFANAVKALTTQEQIAASRALKLPTLIVHGTKDHVLPHAAGVELAQNISGAHFVTVDEAGHAVFFTDHDVTNREIVGLIQRITSQSANGA